MQDKYKLFWTKTAKEDLKSIIEYISVDSKDRAKKILKKIEKESVFIMGVFDSRRNLEDILMNRLIR